MWRTCEKCLFDWIHLRELKPLLLYFFADAGRGKKCFIVRKSLVGSYARDLFHCKEIGWLIDMFGIDMEDGNFSFLYKAHIPLLTSDWHSSFQLHCPIWIEEPLELSINNHNQDLLQICIKNCAIASWENASKRIFVAFKLKAKY